MNDLKDWFSRRRQAIAPKSTLKTRTVHRWRDDPALQPDNLESIPRPPSSTSDRKSILKPRTAHRWRDDPALEPDNLESISGPPSSTSDRDPLGSKYRLRERKDLRGDLCRDDLWGLAYKQLVVEDESLVRGYEMVLGATPIILGDSAADIQEQVQSVLALKRKQILQRQWRLQWGNKSIKVRAQIDSIVKTISAFKEVGSVAANVDPLHAGLPWAGICFLLAVST